MVITRKIKQLNINNKTFKNKDGSKTRIEKLASGKIIPYKKELWKKDVSELFRLVKKKYGKMYFPSQSEKKKKTLKKKIDKTKVKKRGTLKIKKLKTRLKLPSKIEKKK